MIRAAYIMQQLGSGQSWLQASPQNGPRAGSGVSNVDRRRQSVETVMAAVLKGLSESGAIAKETGMQRSYVLNLLHELADAGQLQRTTFFKPGGRSGYRFELVTKGQMKLI